MTYLLAKYTLLFLVASLFGYILGFWWSRRGMVDVTENYQSLRKASARSHDAEWTQLWSRMDKLPETIKPPFFEINSRLDSIDVEIRKLARQLRSEPESMAITPIATKAADPVILSAALYGNKDDLKLISGVGPKLEDLLNKNGVYYFWQVASWDGSDIDFIDERLDVFRGRISRDNWVDQAEQRSQEPGAASAPSR